MTIIAPKSSAMASAVRNTRGANGTLFPSSDSTPTANAISVAMQLFPQKKVDVLLGLIKIRMPYPDCTIDFIRRCNDLAQMVSNGCVQISAPFADIGKDDVLMRLKDSQILPKETWSCYYGKEEPCGKCPACIDRKILEV